VEKMRHNRAQAGRTAYPASAGRYNETLCKILCHNFIVLIHEMREVGLTRYFGMLLKPSLKSLFYVTSAEVKSAA
jgi:hypothetical protein